MTSPGGHPITRARWPMGCSSKHRWRPHRVDSGMQGGVRADPRSAAISDSDPRGPTGARSPAAAQRARRAPAAAAAPDAPAGCCRRSRCSRLESAREALETLRQALELGRQSGAIRSFRGRGRRVSVSCCASLRPAFAAAATGRPRTCMSCWPPSRGAEGGAEVAQSGKPNRKSAYRWWGPAPVLSTRETQILQRLSQGYSNLAVGQQLFPVPKYGQVAPQPEVRQVGGAQSYPGGACCNTA